MNEDLEILRKVLHREGYTPTYTDIILKKVEDTGRERLTPQAIYTILLYDLGRTNARDIAEYFEEYKQKGNYRNKLERFIDRSPWME